MSSQRSDHGICVSKERCLAILTEDIQDLLPEEKKTDYERAVNRVLYELDKMSGITPKVNKGKYVGSWYTCTRCGRKVNIEYNFCPNCGYQLLWSHVRCMTVQKQE